MSELKHYFNSQEAKLEFHMEIRKALIQESLRIGEAQDSDVADLLNNMIFAVDKVFEKLE